MKNKIHLSLKRGLNNSKKLIFAASLAISSLLAFQANAQNMQWWDPQGLSMATNGTWDTVTANWANSSALTASTVTFNNNGYFPVFSAGTGGATNMNINVPGAVNCQGLGDAETTNGTASGAAVTNLNFNGAGSINLPAGLWPFECGNSAPAPTITINVPITGTGGIVQHNNGSLSLYGNNTYSGGTQTTGGQIVNYNNNNSFGTGIITNEGGNAIFLCTNGTANIVTITNAFFVNIGASIFDWGDGNTILSGPVNIYSTTQIKNNGGSGTVLTISGPISSVGGAFGVNLETPSSGTMTLNGANTYTGPTGIGDGGAAVVSVSSINNVSSPLTSSSLGAPTTVANGTIAMGGAGAACKLIYTGPGETSDRVINLTGSTGPGIIEMDGAGPLVFTSPLTATVAGAKSLGLQGTSTATNTFAGAIVNGSATVALAKAQAGSWILSGLNTFTGPITNSGGTLTIGGAGDLGNSGGSGSYAGAISNSAAFVYASSAAQTLSGVISGVGSVQQIGSGNLTLSGANTYTGATTVGVGSTLIVSGTGKISGGTPITDNGTINITSTAGLTANLIAGTGTFNQNGAGATTTLTNVNNNTFSGLFTVNNGTLSINGDSTMGTPPATPLANDITLNGGTPNGLRANAATTLNPNRGVTLGVNGGEIQVASGAGTCTYNGIISGSGPFQDGQNVSTGAGILALGGSESYTNTTSIVCGTLRLLATGSLGNSSGIIMSNAAIFDVSSQSPFALSTSNNFTAYGGTNSPSILGPVGGNVNFGSQNVYLSYVPALTNGDPTNASLTISQATLVLNGNTIDVTNNTALPIDVGYYALIQCTNGISVTAPLTLNYFGPVVANTIQSLTVVGNALVLQVAPAAGYTGTTFTNLPASMSVPYGTATVTFSGTVSAAGPIYPTMGETVTITLPNVLTNTAQIDDNTGDFSTNVTINTLAPTFGRVNYSYPGDGTLAPAFDTSSTFTITKAPVTVTATNQTKTYGQTIPSGTGQTAFTATGLQNGDTIGTVSLAFSGTPAGSISNAPVAGSPYTITPSAATGGTFVAGDYTITYVPGTLTVNPLPVGLTGTNIYNGAATAPFSILSITNKVDATDVVAVASGSVTLAGSAAGPETISSGGTLTLSGAQAGNYTTTGAIGSVTVNPLPVGLTGTNIYNGAATAPFSILSITNIVGGDVVNLASGSATLASPTAGPETITDATGLTLGGAQAGDYTTTGAIGSVTVNPLPVGLTGTRYYDGTATAVFSILTITNIVGSDIVNLVSGSVTLASPANGSEPITSASGLTLGGAQAGDYTTAGAIGAVAVTANSSPTSLVFSTANNAMTLSWPLDHTGWTLEAQTNSVSAGFSTNWSPVGGSTTTNQVVLPIDPNNGCVFYQLIYNP